MAYLDKNGLNYYSQKVSGKIQDVKDDLNELKIIKEEEFEVIEAKWVMMQLWAKDSNDNYEETIDGSSATIEVSSGEKYFISTDARLTQSIPAVILLNSKDVIIKNDYNKEIIQSSYVVETYGENSVFEQMITIPQDVQLMIVNIVDGNYTPEIKKINEAITVEKLADAAPMDSDVQSMLLEVFNNALTPQELEDLVFLSNVESEVF